MKTNRRSLFWISMMVLLPLAACRQFSSASVPTITVPTQIPYPTYTPHPTYTPYPTYTPDPRYTPFPTYTPYIPTTSADISYPNSPIALTVYFPGNYALVKGDEENRRGSFVHYKFVPFGDFIPATNPYFSSQPPYFYEIQFFDEESIGTFLENCAKSDLGGMPCFEGDYPDLDRYNALNKAFPQNGSYDDYVLERYGDRDYLTTTIGCGGGYCNIRQYTTFIGNIMIDIWILLDPSDIQTQTELSDKLFRSFYIETH